MKGFLMMRAKVGYDFRASTRHTERIGQEVQRNS